MGDILCMGTTLFEAILYGGTFFMRATLLDDILCLNATFMVATFWKAILCMDATLLDAIMGDFKISAPSLTKHSVPFYKPKTAFT